MYDRKMTEIEYELLHDSEFVMWCLMPTEELDCKWEQWQKNHPEAQFEFARARAILKSTRFNALEVPDERSEKLWLQLQYSIKKECRKRYFILARYAAACILVLLVSVSVIMQFTHKTTMEGSTAEVMQMTKDTLHTEVTLIIDGQKQVEIEDNALIAYDAGIKVKGREQEEKVIQNIGDKDIEQVTMNTLVVPRGRRSSLLLEDGSRVWINSGSVLRFPSHFQKNQRVIEADGEIYIEVEKSNIPFYVKTNKFTVNVLGTKFNVSSYKEDDECSVVLVEGSVNVKTIKDKDIKLFPNQKISFCGDQSRVEKVDVYDYISWKDGLLRFKRETMTNILMRLSRYYNVPIKCAPGIANRRNSGKLVLFDDIEQVMETFSMLYNTRYHFESDTLLIEY